MVDKQSGQVPPPQVGVVALAQLVQMEVITTAATAVLVPQTQSQVLQ